MESVSWDFGELWNEVVDQFHGGKYSIHGPRHWQRVMDFGLRISETSGADVQVVRLFALFHDSRRENDGYDPGHGYRGAELAKELRGQNRFQLEDKQFEQLHFACHWHTDQTHHEDPTIATCWDADRLDLGRVRIIPNAKYLNTTAAKRAASIGPDNFLNG